MAKGRGRGRNACDSCLFLCGIVTVIALFVLGLYLSWLFFGWIAGLLGIGGAAHLSSVDQSINMAHYNLPKTDNHEGKITALISWSDIETLKKFKILDDVKAEILWHFLQAENKTSFWSTIFQTSSGHIMLKDGRFIANPFFAGGASQATNSATETLNTQTPSGPSAASVFWSKTGQLFTFANVMYVLGGLIVAGSMTFFMTVAWEAFKGAGVFILSSIYAVGFYFVGDYLLKRDKDLAASMFFLMTASSAPLIAYGLVRSLGMFSKKGQNGFFAFTHAVYVGRDFLPLEIFTLAASYSLLQLKKSVFVLLPFWMSSALLVRDLPYALPFGSAPRAWISMFLSSGLIFASTSQEVFLPSMKSSHELGISFLPNSSSWGLYLAVVVFLAAFVNIQASHTRVYKDLLFPSLFVCISSWLVFMNYPEWDFLLAPFSFSASVIISVLPFFVMDSRRPRSAASIFIGCAVVLMSAHLWLPDAILSVPAVRAIFSRFFSSYVSAFIAFHILRLWTGAVMIFISLLVFSAYQADHDSKIYFSMSFFLLSPAAILGVLFTQYHSAIAFALLLVQCLYVTLAIVYPLSSQLPRSSEDDRRFAKLASALSYVVIILAVVFDRFPVKMYFGVDRASTALSLYVVAMVIHFPLSAVIDKTSIRDGFFPVSQFSALVVSLLGMYNFQSIVFTFPFATALWLIFIDYPQLARGATARWRVTRDELASAWGGLAYAVIVSRSALVFLNFPNDFISSSSSILLLYGYASGFMSLGYFAIIKESLLLAFTYLAYSASGALYSYIWIHVLSIVSVGFFMFAIAVARVSIVSEIQKGLILHFTGFGVFAAALLASALQGNWFVGLLLELVGICGIGWGFFFLIDRDGPLRTKVVVEYLTSLVLLFASSFRSSSNGYAALIGSLLCLGFTGTFVAELRRQKKANVMNSFFAILVACACIFVSPKLENLFLYWIPLLTIVSAQFGLLVELKFKPIALMLASCVPVILTGIAVQAKLLVALGYVVVFLGINALAISIFPSSLVFPFVLVFCGIAFIYAGMTFEKDENANMFDIKPSLTGNAGNIERWTSLVAAYVSPTLEFLRQEDPVTKYFKQYILGRFH